MEQSEKNGPNKNNSQTKLLGQFLCGKENFTKLGKDWDELFARAQDAPPFLSHAWIQTFINHNRFRGKPCLIVVWKDSKLIALLPFSIQHFYGIRIGKLIGTEEPSYLGLLLDPKYPEAAAVIAETWAREKVAHVFQNKHVFSLDNTTHSFVAEINRRGFAHKYGYKRVCHYIELGCSFDEYLQNTKSGKRRKKLRYAERQVFNTGNVEIIRYIGKDITPEIHQRIAQIQKESWMKRRGAAVLGQPFYQSLLTNMSEAGLSCVWLMKIDGDDAAFAYAFITHEKLYYHWPAFKLKYESKLSIGQILLMQIIRDACQENIILFDFGQGEAEYKRFWSTDTQQVEWVVAGRGFIGYIVILCYRIAWWLAGQKDIFQLYRRLRRRLKISRQLRYEQ